MDRGRAARAASSLPTRSRRWSRSACGSGFSGRKRGGDHRAGRHPRPAVRRARTSVRRRGQARSAPGDAWGGRSISCEPTRGNPLLVADHVTPPLADALRAQGVEFIDAAGNAFLNQPPALGLRQGPAPCRRGTGPRTRPCLSGHRTPGPLCPAGAARACGSSLPGDRPGRRSGARHRRLGHGRAAWPRLRREGRRTSSSHQRRAPTRPLDRSICAHPSAKAAPGSIPGRHGRAPAEPRHGRTAC